MFDPAPRQKANLRIIRVLTNTRRPARSTMTLRRRTERAGLAMPARRDCSVSIGHRQPDGNLPRIEFAPNRRVPVPVRLIDLIPLARNRAGLNQTDWRPARVARVVAGPSWGADRRASIRIAIAIMHAYSITYPDCQEQTMNIWSV
jgi:hypothetical protein